jgi:hypothetical protein
MRGCVLRMMGFVAAAMNAIDNYYLVTSGTDWVLKKKGSDTPLLSDPNKEKATQGAVAYVKSRGGSLRIQKQDGTFEEERTYPQSADPTETPG